ncbi:MAG: EAL domain-containing protein [Lachnospiraceae bacterium]|nr:EAL domain-containing protein [Lachnospiraceae bacterium]
MKILLGAILILALIVIGFCLYKTYKEQNNLARTVKYVLFIGFIIVFFNVVSLYTTSKFVCHFAYSMYFMASDWLLYHLFKFSMEYVGLDFRQYVKRGYMIALLVADSLSIIINSFTEHLYELKEVNLFGGESFYELSVKPFFYLHYAIVLMLVVFCLISLFYRAFKSPRFYRNKYLLIAIVMIALVIMNVFSVTSAVDVSVIGYAVEAVCIYYCAFVYTPQKLLPETMYRVTDNMKIGVLLLDIDGNKLFCNKFATKMFDANEPMIDKKGETLEKWCMDKYGDSKIEFVEDRSFYLNGKEHVLKIQLQRMLDENNIHQGGYFVIQDRTKEIENAKREQYLASHDTLTGVYNKEQFISKSEKYIKRHPDEDLYIICTDFKDFKMINDLLGTKVGDMVLINYAGMLDEMAEKFEVYGRLGNDIFGILMKKEYFSEELFENKAEKYFAETGIETSFPIVKYLGIYEITDREVPVSVMCDRARMAIASIKGDYTNTVAFYDRTMRSNVKYEQELISGLSRAIENEELKMYLQPQTTKDGKLLGAEALVRWEHPEQGFIMPGKFIPVFEKNGLIAEVDKYMWETACKQIKKWNENGHEDLYISVNISPRDFYFLDIYQIFTDLIKKYDISPKSLKLEITETAIVMDVKRQMELIGKLRDAGFIVEIDDFGSGYSSLNMLKDLYVDILKIDMVFLRKSNDEERSKKILQMIITLAKQLGMPAITEGVETVEQVEFLSEMGCEMFQGYYFAKPMSVLDFEKQYL